MRTALIPASIIAAAALIPALAFAAEPNGAGILVSLLGLVTLLIWLVAGLALLYFFWGLAGYVLNSGDSKKQQEGRRVMVQGVIALFVMVSIGGILRIIQETFGLTGADLSWFAGPPAADQATTQPRNLTELIGRITALLRSAVWVIQACALAAFFWGVSQFILHAGNTEKRKKAQATLIWGVLILTLFFSFNAVILILERTFFGEGVSTGGPGGGVVRDCPPPRPGQIDPDPDCM